MQPQSTTPYFRTKQCLPAISLSGEEWRPVPGHEGLYEVSNKGRVRSIRLLTPRIDADGYRRVATRDTAFKRRTPRIHQLVAFAFLGARPKPNWHVNHLDGDKDNNAVENLRWVSPSENSLHAFRLGLHGPPNPLRGEDSPASKLTEKDIREICALEGRMSQSQIGKRYGVTQGNVWLILRRKSWRHLQV